VDLPLALVASLVNGTPPPAINALLHALAAGRPLNLYHLE
jgi:hypothetical protein